MYKNSWFLGIDTQKAQHEHETRKANLLQKSMGFDVFVLFCFLPDAADRDPILYVVAGELRMLLDNKNIGRRSWNLWRLCGMLGRSKFKERKKKIYMYE